MADENPDPSIAGLNSEANLQRLLDELAEHPERIEDITDRLREIFNQDKTVMILDMSGFTRATRAGNLISFLLMIHQMRQLALPCVEENGGILIRADHDNLTCLFDEVEQAIEASRAITERLESANVILPSTRDLYVSVGIGYGPIVNVDNKVIYGDEVNLASKLGEDIAELGQVFLTEAAHDRLKGKGVEAEKKAVNVSGINLTYYALT